VLHRNDFYSGGEGILATTMNHDTALGPRVSPLGPLRWASSHLLTDWNYSETFE
jgi:hypothetical protein